MKLDGVSFFFKYKFMNKEVSHTYTISPTQSHGQSHSISLAAVVRVCVSPIQNLNESSSGRISWKILLKMHNKNSRTISHLSLCDSALGFVFSFARCVAVSAAVFRCTMHFHGFDFTFRFFFSRVRSSARSFFCSSSSHIFLFLLLHIRFRRRFLLM